MRIKFLKDIDEPMETSAKILNRPPISPAPKTDTPEPIRAKCLNDNELPPWKKSSTEQDDPNRNWLNTEIAEPKRT
jgi:hypothetical protein